MYHRIILVKRFRDSKVSLERSLSKIPQFPAIGGVVKKRVSQRRGKGPPRSTLSSVRSTLSPSSAAVSLGVSSRSGAKRFQKSFARFSAARADRIKERLRPSSTRNHVAAGISLESQFPNVYQSSAPPPSSTESLGEI